MIDQTIDDNDGSNEETQIAQLPSLSAAISSHQQKKMKLVT